MAAVSFIDEDGNYVEVSASNPLPTSGAGGGGMNPDDIQAAAPATWDPETGTIGVAIGTGANQAAKGNHSHTPASIGAATAAQGDKADSAVQPSDLSPYAKTADLALADASVAANVPAGSTVDDVIAALIAAGMMADA